MQCGDKLDKSREVDSSYRLIIRDWTLPGVLRKQIDESKMLKMKICSV